ncbi:uncharacterized protein FIBRA_04305 [Fibroporia radiculosa]|uniref:Uncharacterized protein n=1 Tax=Fibroporia radiculosa TaxID=599839 RepID=J4GP13_9APHY|nr:uncharacterized protein FIBRA_04305 [Fibroporia radiculosa]CCM02225.1 predicted protein [Fibroporia radiculosa]
MLLPLTVGAILVLQVMAHASIWHPSMWGFNVTMQTFPYDNRPVAPLINYTFDQWWFHGHLDYPPNDGDFFELPAGKPVTAQIACDKGATTYFASDPGGNIQSGDNVCPGSPISEFHTTGIDDVKGCGLAVTYKSNVTDVKPDDFTDASLPGRGLHLCLLLDTFSRYHELITMKPDSGSEQNYMNGFRCNVSGSTSTVSLAAPQVARRCGADPANGRPEASPGNCTYGAKQPLYWFQAEGNNMFEGTYSPPFYNDLYNFLDGAQEDIFEDSYPNGIPPPSPNSTVVPVANLAGVASTSTPLPLSVTGPPVSFSTISGSPSSSPIVASPQPSPTLAREPISSTLNPMCEIQSLHRRSLRRRSTWTGFERAASVVRRDTLSLQDRNRLWNLF